MKYYKIVYEHSIILFKLDENLDAITEMIEEIKTETKLTIQKFDNLISYTRASRNSAVQSMIEKAEEISMEDYEFGYSMSTFLITRDEYIIADKSKKEKEVITETVYV